MLQRAVPSPLHRFFLLPLSFILLYGPFWRRSWIHRLGRLVVLAGYIYLRILIVLLALENSLLYHPTPAAAVWLPPPPGMRVEDVELTTPDGTHIHGWWAAPKDWAPPQGAVLYCHGNAGNVSEWGETLAGWQAQLRTAELLFDYPGYGKSGGAPSEAGCCAAAEAAFDWLTNVQGVPPEKVIVVGRSLGGGPATDVASRHRCRGLVLHSAFTSFPDLAQEKYPWLPARWLVRNRFENLAKIARIHEPVFIVHGTEDALVPFHHGERLFAAAPGLKRLHPMPGKDHDDEWDAACFDDLRRLLDETKPAN